MDFTVQHIGVPPPQLQESFYQGDKGTHFFNSLRLVTFNGLFIDFKPGFVGHSKGLGLGLGLGLKTGVYCLKGEDNARHNAAAVVGEG